MGTRRDTPRRRQRLAGPGPDAWGPTLPELLGVLSRLQLRAHLSTERCTQVGLAFHGQARGAPAGMPVARWDDCLGMLLPDPAAPQGFRWIRARGTTDPGREAMERTGGVPVHPAGAARIRPGLYRESHHAGGYHKWDPDRPAFRMVAGHVLTDAVTGEFGTERWVSDRWLQAPDIPHVQAAHRHGLPPGVSIQRALQRGVWHYGQACHVVLDAAAHQAQLDAAGWQADTATADRLDLLVVDWMGPLSGPYNRGR